MEFSKKGFTLLELLVVLSLVAVISVGTMVSWQKFKQKNTLITLENTLQTAVHYGKIIALSLNRSVYLAALPQEKTWQAGIGLYDAINQELLYEWRWKQSGFTIQWKGFDTTRLPIGAHPLHASSNGQIVIRNKMTGEESRLLVNRIGRVRKINSCGFAHPLYNSGFYLYRFV